MNSLQEALPASTGYIALIDGSMGCNIKQGAKISCQISTSDFSVLFEAISNLARWDGFLQIMDRSLNLIDLHLYNLLMRVGQGKDLKRNPDLFQSKNLVQNKGL